MSFLKKSLEKRIQELRKSIEAQTTELAAYEQVLALESGKPLESSPPPASRSEFNGSRSDFVVSVLKEHGAAGVTPAAISAAFAERKITVSKNLVYNVLSLLYKQKKVRKAAGKYYLVAGKTSAAAPQKSRISEEGMRRIIAATKKRWATARAKKK
jgi:hypothetical protein